MLRRQTSAIVGGEEILINCPPEFDIHVMLCSDARDPVNPDNRPEIIRHATPLAPIASGDYMPIRRSYSATAHAAATTHVLNDASPFSVGDVVAVFALDGFDIATTYSVGLTLTAVSYAANTIESVGLAAITAAAAAGVVYEVAANGHMAALADPSNYDACLLLEPSVQNEEDDVAVRRQVRGAFGGSVEEKYVNGPDGDGPDDLLEWAMRNMQFISQDKGS
jgi:hypothetical protein